MAGMTIVEQWVKEGLLFIIVLTVCGHVLFRQTPATQWFAHSDKWAHANGFLCQFYWKELIK